VRMIDDVEHLVFETRKGLIGRDSGRRLPDGCRFVYECRLALLWSRAIVVVALAR
jgi:hypothetical protein